MWYYTIEQEESQGKKQIWASGKTTQSLVEKTAWRGEKPQDMREKWNSQIDYKVLGVK